MLTVDILYKWLFMVKYEFLLQWPKEKGQKDKQRSTKDYTEN